MNNNQDQSGWSDFFQTFYLLAYLSSVWRARHTYSLIRDLKINTLLELGAGTGLCAHFLAAKTKAQTTLLDKDRQLVTKLKEKYPDKEIIHADLFNFSTKRKWDLVYSLGLIEHFPDEKAIKAIKIHKKLSSQYVLIAVPVESFIMKYLFYPLRRYQLSKYHLSYHKFYKPGDLEKEFQKAGLKPWRIKKNPLGITILSKKDK